jgi:hypothetical protein
MVGTAGFEPVACVKSCVILHISATAKYEKVQGWDGLLSRFVTRRLLAKITTRLFCVVFGDTVNTFPHPSGDKQTDVP